MSKSNRRRSLPVNHRRRIDRHTPPALAFLHPRPSALGEDRQRRAQVAAVPDAVWTKLVNTLLRHAVGDVGLPFVAHPGIEPDPAASEGGVSRSASTRRASFTCQPTMQAAAPISSAPIVPLAPCSSTWNNAASRTTLWPPWPRHHARSEMRLARPARARSRRESVSTRHAPAATDRGRAR